MVGDARGVRGEGRDYKYPSQADEGKCLRDSRKRDSRPGSRRRWWAMVERESSLNEMGWNQDLEVVQNFTGYKGVMN